MPNVFFFFFLAQAGVASHHSRRAMSPLPVENASAAIAVKPERQGNQIYGWRQALKATMIWVSTCHDKTVFASAMLLSVRRLRLTAIWDANHG